MNKHKPWIETSYHGVITENTDVVLLDPPLVALDKDAPVPYAGKAGNESFIGYWVCSTVLHTSFLRPSQLMSVCVCPPSVLSDY